MKPSFSFMRRQLAAFVSGAAVLAAAPAVLAAESTQTLLTVQDARGTAVVPAQPARIAVFDPGTLDALQALEVPVQAVPTFNYPVQNKDLAADSVAKVGGLFEPDMDALQKVQPQLVIVGGRSAASRADLAKLAPVLDMSVDTQHVLDGLARNLTTLGQIYGKQQQAHQLMQDVLQQVQATREAAGKAPAGLLVLQFGDRLNVQAPGSRFGSVFYDTLGVRVPEGVERVVQTPRAKPAAPAVELTGEAAEAAKKEAEEKRAAAAAQSRADLVQMDPEWLFIIDRNAGTGSTAVTAQELMQRPEFAQMRAVKSGKVVFLQPQNWYLLGVSGPTALRQAATQIREALSR